MKTEQRHIVAIAMGVAILFIDLIFFFRSVWFIP